MCWHADRTIALPIVRRLGPDGTEVHRFRDLVPISDRPDSMHKRLIRGHKGVNNKRLARNVFNLEPREQQLTVFTKLAKLVTPRKTIVTLQTIELLTPQQAGVALAYHVFGL